MVDLSREQLTVGVLVAALALSSVVLSPAMVFGPSNGPTDAKAGETYYTSTVQQGGGSGTNGGPGTFDESDLFAVPDGYTETSTSAAEDPPSVQASAGAQTMQVTVTEDNGDVALQLSDDRVHDGRWVSVPASWFESEVGGIPQVAYVEHESGDEYKTSLFARGDSVAFYVEEFSTNVVTFSGEVSITGEFSDGGSAQYELSNFDSASDPMLNLTGVESTETETWSGVSSGGTIPVSVDGNKQPTDASATLTGSGFARTDSVSASVASAGKSVSVGVDGNTPPIGPDGSGEPELTVTGASTASDAHNPAVSRGSGKVADSTFAIGTGSSGRLRTSIELTAPRDMALTELRPYIENARGSDYGARVDIYLSSGSTDSTWNEGTKIKDGWDPDWSETRQSISLDERVSLSGGQTYEIEFVTQSKGGGLDFDSLYIGADDGASSTMFTRADGSETSSFSRAANIELGAQKASAIGVDVDGDGSNEQTVDGPLADGEATTVPLSELSTSTDAIDISMGTGWADVEVSWTEREGPVDPSLDVDGDGSPDVAHSGVLVPGESVSSSVPLYLSTSEMDVSTSSGEVAVELSATERLVTEDVVAELNARTVSHSGTLAAGETVSMTFNQSALQEGTNRLNVSVGDGSLSSDAPEPRVGVELSHDAVDQQAVDYGGGQWTETYNVTETYATARENASLTIPYQSDVYRIQNIEARVNESSWTSVDGANYELENTTLTVDLDGVYGGAIPDGSTVEVRTTGITVDASDASITVTDPTTPGQPLASTVQIDNWGTDARLDVSGTPRGDRLHYTSDESWNATETARFTGDGTQTLRLPSADAGDQFRVSTLPLRLEPHNGDIEARVPDDRVNRSQPVFKVTPGDRVGDAYDVTFTNASDGKDYILWSETNEIVVDSGTASSPLTLSDDEDNVALMQFRVDDGTVGVSDSGGSGGGAPVPMPTTGGDTNFLPLIGVAIAGGLVIVASRNDGAVAETGANAANRIEGALGGIPILGPALGKGLGGVVESTGGLLEAVVGNQTVALGIVGALLVGAVQGGIIEVPQSSLTLIVVAGIGIYSLVALREFGEFTTERWAAILAATTVVTLQTVSKGSLLTAIVESDVWPILALAAVYLAYRTIQGIQSPDQVTEVVLDTEQQQDQNGGDGR